MSTNQQAGCSLCEAPAQDAPAGSLQLCDYHNPGGEPVSEAEHLQACLPAPYVTPGHPTEEGAGYNCHCGACLAGTEQEEEA